MKKFLLMGLLLIVACQRAPVAPITNFEECIAAGNPVMESYPRQCKANGQTFVEVTPLPESAPIPSTANFHECTAEENNVDVCTREYNPVCGIVDNGIRCVTTPCQSTDAKMFSNGCSACSGQAYGYYEGACVDQEFVVCQETVTGFDPVEYAENNNGICVDICPKNYDSYITQIGVMLCIEHYGAQEISKWDTCTRSSEGCNCVKTYETTSDEEIPNAKYRCVPERYAERLLFRAGLDRLDENGEQSVAIA